MSATKSIKKKLSTDQSDKLLHTLQTRFKKNMKRHKGLDWNKVEAKLKSKPEKLWSLNAMEETGGEPDVVGYDKKTSEFIFYDCASESPKERRSLCYEVKRLRRGKNISPQTAR